jgi:hypothetical protein
LALLNSMYSLDGSIKKIFNSQQSVQSQNSRISSAPVTFRKLSYSEFEVEELVLQCFTFDNDLCINLPMQ